MIQEILSWIESHEVTVDLLKWAALIFFAWASGVFGFIKNLRRKPKVKVCSITSRCFVEEIKEPEAQGVKDAVRAAFLLQIEVINLRTIPIVVRTLEIQVRKKCSFKSWGDPISAISLPNRVQHEMGSGVKIMRNWFSLFNDGWNLTVPGDIPARDANSGFALFVSATWGDWNPVIVKDFTHIKVIACLATGEKYVGYGTVQITEDPEFFEKLLPGGLAQVRHSSAWNVPVRFSKHKKCH